MDIKTIGSYSYDDISVFSKCCHERMEREYSLQHSPKPLSLEKDLTKVIEMILWYIPCIDSIQSYKHELIEERSFESIYKMMSYERPDIDKKILIFDNIKLKKDHKKQLDEIGVFVIDYTGVKELLNGRDVLSEL